MSNIVRELYLYVADSSNFYERTDMLCPCVVISKGDANGVCNVGNVVISKDVVGNVLSANNSQKNIYISDKNKVFFRR